MDMTVENMERLLESIESLIAKFTVRAEACEVSCADAAATIWDRAAGELQGVIAPYVDPEGKTLPF